MPRDITIILGLVLFSILGVIIMSAVAYEIDRQTNQDIGSKGEEYFLSRVKLFAIPTSEEEIPEYDKLDYFKWLLIGQGLLQYRNEIEQRELRDIQSVVSYISLYFASLCFIMIYAPALWLAKYRFQNEIQKVLFHIFVGSMLHAGTVLRLYSYLWITKRNYTIISEIARQVIVEKGGINFTSSIHFCYYQFMIQTHHQHSHEDWHHVSEKMHNQLDNLVNSAYICHPEALTITIVFLCSVSLMSYYVLFFMTTRLCYRNDELLTEIEDADYLTMENRDSGGYEFEELQQLQFVPDRNPKNVFYVEDEDMTDTDAETMVENLLDTQQLEELREIYLTNYYTSKKKSHG